MNVVTHRKLIKSRSWSSGSGVLALTAMVLHRLALATTANVNVDPGDFNPQQVGININDSVKWIWVSNFHNTVSDTALWASPVQNNGATFIHTFTAVGTFPYKCTVHGFGGIVTVQAAAGPPSVLSGPRFIPPSTFEFNYSAGSGLSYVVQRSPNRSNWVSLKTNIASGTSVLFQDTNASASRDFYRVFQLSNP